MTLFCVVSVRRAKKLKGIREIFTVQCQFEAAGITPTWYVDEESLKDYQALGLKAESLRLDSIHTNPEIFVATIRMLVSSHS